MYDEESDMESADKSSSSSPWKKLQMSPFNEMKVESKRSAGGSSLQHEGTALLGGGKGVITLVEAVDKISANDPHPHEPRFIGESTVPEHLTPGFKTRGEISAARNEVGISNIQPFEIEAERHPIRGDTARVLWRYIMLPVLVGTMVLTMLLMTAILNGKESH